MIFFYFVKLNIFCYFLNKKIKVSLCIYFFSEHSKIKQSKYIQQIIILISVEMYAFLCKKYFDNSYF
jgi:hypothetical protein